MQDRAQQGIESARTGIQNAIEQIPPEAWPIIDLMMQILVGLFIVWLALALIAWWRRRAYNLTIASTARRNRKAQPDFLSVDQKARRKAMERGEAHAKALDDREAAADDALAALKAAKEPVTIASRVASAATLVMSIFTLLTGITGAVFNVTRMGDYVEQASAADRLLYLVQEHPIGTAVAVFVIGFNAWRYFADEKWKKV